MKNLIKKFHEVKFIIPIIVGIIGLLLIHKFFPVRNTDEKVSAAFFYFCDIWFSFSASKHWWKMARNKEYEKERKRWLKLQPDERSGFWLSYKLGLATTIVLLAILAMLFLYQTLILN